MVAVKALLDDDDRVTELESPDELPPAGELPVDAVVVDLPSASRKASVERVRGRFSGPLVVLLAHGEDTAKARLTYRCSVLTRPFGMAQLWSLLVHSASEALTEVIPAVDRDISSPGPSGSPPSRSVGPLAPPRVVGPEPSPRWVGPEPSPRAPAAAAAEAPADRVPGWSAAAAPERPPVVPERPLPAAAERPGAGTVERPAAEVPEQAPAVQATRAARGAGADRRAERRPDESVRVAAWSWRLRRFQHPEAPAADPGELTQPIPAVSPAPPGNGVVPVRDRAGRPAEPAPARSPVEPPAPRAPAPWRATAEVRPPTATSSAAHAEVTPDPPEAVAGRLAERLGADTVALLLDNNHGLLEVAGGVGLTAAERQLQVEYGHEVLLELFRVGVGLIEDTERVRPLIRGIPGSRSQSLVMVPLVHEGHGFGALIIGRTSPPGQSRPEFTEPEIETLMDFAEDVAAPLRSTVLLRRLKGQLNTPDRT
ncbi:MAG TPA: GAF domain-containing protein [Actinomycetes bacterium]|nr:GAF domain-containing protein [Actinomycetes bacterium]